MPEQDSAFVKGTRVLIAVSPTSSYADIVQEAAARPWCSGSVFSLLSVVDPYTFPKAPLILEKATGDACKRLKSAAESLAQAGWNATTKMIVGNPRRAVSKYAADWQADLIMVGSHGLSDMARILLGSTAQAVLRRAPCSVEIVRPCGGGGTGPRGIRILIATDGSEFSVAALHAVASRSWPERSEAKLLSVPDFILPPKESSSLEIQEIEELNNRSLQQARDAVANGLEILSRTNLTVHADVPLVWEAPAGVILAEAEKWQAQMIVLGSHGRRGFDRLAMGSVSEAVALHANCSVEVIRSEPSKANHPKRGEMA